MIFVVVVVFMCVCFTCTFLRHRAYKLLVYAAASFVFESNIRVSSTSVILGSLAKLEKKK